jgi:hypothetical protein
MKNNNCCGCYDNYPFENQTHYGVQCTLNACSEGHFKPSRQVPPPPKTPIGPIKESAFRLVDGFPYLVDTTHFKYGPFIKASEQLETKIAQRRDTNCIHIDAVFDMTNSSSTNQTLMNYFTTIVERQYEELKGVLPVLQEKLHFRVYYYITDRSGQTIHENYATVYGEDVYVHPTEIPGYFVASFKNILIAEIPDFEYYGAGDYTLTLTKVEIFATGVNTLDHTPDPALNPFYAWTNDYQKIILNNEEINATEPDFLSLPIGVLPLNKSYMFQSAVTTKLKICFTAYMSDFIYARNMFNVWSALNEPTRELLAQIKTELDTLSDKYDELKAIEDAQAVTIETMQGKIAELEQKIEVEKDITEYAFETPVHAGEFMYIQYGRIYQATEDYVTPADDGTKTTAELFAEDIDAGRLIELRPSALYSVPNPNPGETTTDPVTPDPQDPDPQDPDPQQDPQDP